MRRPGRVNPLLMTSWHKPSWWHLKAGNPLTISGKMRGHGCSASPLTYSAVTIALKPEDSGHSPRPSAETATELTLLQAMPDRTPVATDAAVEDGRRKLLHRIDPSAPVAQPARRWQTAKRAGIISLATAAILAALVAGDVLGPTGWRGAATAQAAQVLNEAAKTTIKTADPVVNPGQYLKLQSSNLWGSFSTDQRQGVPVARYREHDHVHPG